MTMSNLISEVSRIFRDLNSTLFVIIYIALSFPLSFVFVHSKLFTQLSPFTPALSNALLSSLNLTYRHNVITLIK
ncbi:hypothetical protein Pst134EA_009131 [Puccinia striiformis f. sp. tritici]|uniref:hypothetical protein n=1 Tax=Puccinia striiformis f. sp. tritici TaxID=168172 RepID=UPI002008338A|nr:hypothetical protein Pst134EA_009131 [Puccinia striiformis f. sp. tritici]KAH9468597.1 hypothetical protein Pst134EA_009131 [Puccinia striiformis f. sp. tritici]